MPSGKAYDVQVSGSPTSPWQTCSVSNASGSVTTGAVTNVGVSCTTSTYWVEVYVNANWANPGLAINDTVSAASQAITNGSVGNPSGQFGFELLPSGTSYNLTLTQSVVNVGCTLAPMSGSALQGTITNGAVAVEITCPTLYPIHLSFSWSGAPCSAPLNFYDGYQLITLGDTASSGTYTFSDERFSSQGYEVGFSSPDSQCGCSGTYVLLEHMASPSGTVTASCQEAIQ